MGRSRVVGAVQFDEELDGGQAQGSGQKLCRGCATEKGREAALGEELQARNRHVAARRQGQGG